MRESRNSGVERISETYVSVSPPTASITSTCERIRQKVITYPVTMRMLITKIGELLRPEKGSGLRKPRSHSIICSRSTNVNLG